jgi:hypothetical protein
MQLSRIHLPKGALTPSRRAISPYSLASMARMRRARNVSRAEPEGTETSPAESSPASPPPDLLRETSDYFAAQVSHRLGQHALLGRAVRAVHGNGR